MLFMRAAPFITRCKSSCCVCFLSIHQIFHVSTSRNKGVLSLVNRLAKYADPYNQSSDFRSTISCALLRRHWNKVECCHAAATFLIRCGEKCFPKEVVTHPVGNVAVKYPSGSDGLVSWLSYVGSCLHWINVGCWGPHVGVMVVGYPSSCKLGLIMKQNVFRSNGVAESSVLKLHNHWLESLYMLLYLCLRCLHLTAISMNTHCQTALECTRLTVASGCLHYLSLIMKMLLYPLCFPVHVVGDPLSCNHCCTLLNTTCLRRWWLGNRCFYSIIVFHAFQSQNLYSLFVNSAFIIAQCGQFFLWATRLKTTNHLSTMTEHKLLVSWWICACGVFESTVWALVGALCWNGWTSS